MKIDAQVRPTRSGAHPRTRATCIRLPENEHRRALNFPASCEAWRQHEMTTLLAFVARALAQGDR